MRGHALQDLLDFLCALDAHHIFFALGRVRDDASMVAIAVPGGRWEVENFANGRVEAEVFTAPGTMEGQEALRRLVAKHHG
jgi:hypothetical protein